MADILKLQTNIPEVIALQFSEGKPVQSQYSGDQVMYSLADGRVMYLAPFVAEKIKQAGVAAGVPFSICRKEVLRGNRKSLEYEIVNLCENAVSTASRPQAPSSPAPAGHTAAPATNGTVAAPQSHHNGTNGNGNGSNGIPPMPETPARTPITVEEANARLLARTGKLALDAMLEVEAYARERGLEGFTLGPDNAQRIWMTLYIQSTRNGGR